MTYSVVNALKFGLLVASVVTSANVPTFTVTRQTTAATVRFPDHEDVENSTTVTKNLLETLPPASVAPVTLTTLKPSKSDKVNIVGNYSDVAIQQQMAKANEDEIVVKASDLLELLDFLRELPRERFEEIYPQVLSKNDPHSSTESFAEKLNKLRQQEAVTSTTTTTTKTSTSTTSTTSSTTVIPDTTTSSSSEEDETTIFENFDEQPTTLTELESEQEEDVVTQVVVPAATTTSSNVTTQISIAEDDNIPPLLGNSNLHKKVATTTPTYYEFTDYPPPLPPSLSQPPSTESGGGEFSEDRRGRDASFAVGVAVGILACVVVAAACVTWCICRKHWGRRNVYATMEVEEIPKAFTKPGPPVILPNELLHSAANLHKDSQSNSQGVHPPVMKTEL